MQPRQSEILSNESAYGDSAMIYQGKARHPVVEVVLHCAAVQGNWHRGKTAVQVLAEVDAWHRKNGWRKIGYHGIFMPDGTFIQGRQFTEVGAHVVERNRGTIGFLMIESQTITKIGRFEDWFTEMQRKAVRAKIKSLPGIQWVTGHNDYANKLCPGFRVRDEDWLSR
jgi:hypothetical protein